jgi:hypothetical protein
MEDILHHEVVDRAIGKRQRHRVGGEIAVAGGDDVGGDETALAGVGGGEELLEVAGAAADFHDRAE